MQRRRHVIWSSRRAVVALQVLAFYVCECEGRTVHVCNLCLYASWSVYNEELIKDSEVMLDGVWPEKTEKGVKGREGQTNKEEKKKGATGKLESC